MVHEQAVRTRFAPSPTGDLHLGGAWTALASWLFARARGGTVVLRIEDLDPPRVVPGSADSIRDDLLWLGLDWDEGPGTSGPHGPYVQSERSSLYEDALTKLRARGLLYPCDCSRAEIARVASAPHEGEEVRYPGTCRDRDPARAMKRAPSWRLRVPDEVVAAPDFIRGHIEQNLERAVGDFVLLRGDGVFAYHLAVVVDDLAMHISHVLRGADLLASTPRQVYLAHLLEVTPPRYGHLPLVVGGDGARLEKRTRGASVQTLRQAGVRPETIVGALAHGLGFLDDEGPKSPREVLASMQEPVFPKESWRIPDRLAR